MAILTKSNQNLPSRTRLLECVIYDPDTGSFTCKIHQYKSKYHPGDILGSKSSNGYLQIYIDGVPYLAHRLAWLYFYGEIPEHDIDHKDTDRLNNKINNLRKATRSQNLQNQSVKPSNTSGFKGVSFNKQKNKYEAHIRVNSQRIRCGCCNTTFSTFKKANPYFTTCPVTRIVLVLSEVAFRGEYSCVNQFKLHVLPLLNQLRWFSELTRRLLCLSHMYP